MATITFLPQNKTVTAKKDQSILEAAVENDFPLEHICGGNCACTTCHVVVKSGSEHLSNMEDEEKDTVTQAMGYCDHSRLGCQSLINSDQAEIVLEIVS